MNQGASVRDERGAAMVFGMFFAVFLVACVFKMYGLAEVILYREQQQDAADAAVFAAAVMNANGMNLIALINLVMAAVLSVLVGLRLAQTLCLIGLGLCAVLAYPTMGNSLSYVPSLTSSTRSIGKVAEKVEKNLPKILSALHLAGKAISVVVPLGSNARVVEVAKEQYDQRAGFALPGRVTLPVVDGQFIDLCRHAGRFATEVALIPVTPFVGGKVREGLEKAGAAIAQAAPDWFCGTSATGKKPDLDQQREFDPIDLPLMPRQMECNELVKRYETLDAPGDTEQREVDAACGRAAVEYLASSPGKDGRARDGERLCPADCQKNPRPSCPPDGVELCDQAHAFKIEELAHGSGLSSVVSSGAGSPYEQRLKLAHEQCDPRASHDHPLGGYSWIQQEVIYRYDWSPLHKRFERDPSVEVLLPKTELIRKKDEDHSLPCGDRGVVGETYGALPTKVCESVGRCSDESGVERSSGPCRPHDTSRYWQTHVRVTGILRCAELRPHEKVETPDLDLESDLDASKGEDQNTSPFELDPETWLGGSDFQLRAIVVAAPVVTASRELVRFASWDAPGQPVSDAFFKVSQRLGAFGLSQAEYYFDLSEFGQYADPLQPADRVEWIWNQGWVARLRAFRLSYGEADGPRVGTAGYDSEQAAFADPNHTLVAEPDPVDVMGSQAGAQELQGWLEQGGSQ